MKNSNIDIRNIEKAVWKLQYSQYDGQSVYSGLSTDSEVFLFFTIQLYMFIQL